MIRLYGEKDGLPSGTVAQIEQAPDGTVLTVARGRLLELHGGRWTELAAARSLSGYVTQLAFDQFRTLWVLTSKGVWKLSSSNGQFVKTGQTGSENGWFSKAPDGSLWIDIAPNGKNLLQRLSSPISRDSPAELSPIEAGNFLVDSEDCIWMGTGHGLFRINPSLQGTNEGTQPRLIKNSNLEFFTHTDGLSAMDVGPLLEDRLGDIWAGTSAGLDRFRKPTLKRFVDRPIEEPAVLAQCPGGELWLEEFSFALRSIKDGIVIDHGKRLQPHSAHCDQTNSIWIAARDGLFVIRNNELHHVPIPDGIPPPFTREVVGDNEHLLYVLFARNGIWRLTDGSWSRIQETGFDNQPFTLFMDQKKQLWTGSIDGRVALLKQQSVQTFAADPSNPLGLVQAFLESTLGLLVGGTNGIAVVRNGSLQTLSRPDDPVIKGVSGLLQAKNGDIWINGLHGIARIPESELRDAIASSDYEMHSELYSQAGLSGPSAQATELPSAVANPNGTFWFSTSGGVASVDPETIHKSTTAPILCELATTVDGKDLSEGRRINPGYHTVRIRYFGTYLTAPQKVTYRYRLLGADQDWQEVGDRTEAVYTGLRPGHYTFSVAASNGEGVWTEADNSIEFTVLPAYYQRRSFFLACVLVAAILIWIAYRTRVRSIASAIRGQEMVRADERIRIARDLHDTLMQGIQALILQLSVTAKGLPEGSRSRSSMEATLGSADRLVLEGRNRMRTLRARNLTQEEFTCSLRLTASELNQKHEICFSLMTTGQRVDDVDGLMWGELLYIGREAITNSFRHSCATEIAVTLDCVPKHAVLKMADNGIGFSPDTYSRDSTNGHWGFQGMQERAYAIGAVFKCASETGRGTEITVVVPGHLAYRKSSRWWSWPIAKSS